MVGDQKPQSDEANYPLCRVIPQIVWEAARWQLYLFQPPVVRIHGVDPRKESWHRLGHGGSSRRSAPCIERWKRATETGQPFEIEYRLRGAQGQYRWFLSRGIPQRDQEGAIVSWVGTCTDIDDQRRTQEELQRGEAQFRLLAEAIPQMVWMADSRGSVHYLNQQWFDYTGLTYEQSRGWDGSRWFIRTIVKCPHSGQKPWNRGATWRLSNGCSGTDNSYRWHLVRGAPLRDELGAIVQWVGTMTDIDDQRRQARLLERLVRERTADLERSNCQLEEFAAVASHDLQEPLRKIQAFGDRLQTKCSPVLGKQGKEYLERILNSAARMRTLINDLLAFSRITTKMPPSAC